MDWIDFIKSYRLLDIFFDEFFYKVFVIMMPHININIISDEHELENLLANEKFPSDKIDDIVTKIIKYENPFNGKFIHNKHKFYYYIIATNNSFFYICTYREKLRDSLFDKFLFIFNNKNSVKIRRMIKSAQIDLICNDISLYNIAKIFHQYLIDIKHNCNHNCNSVELINHFEKYKLEYFIDDDDRIDDIIYMVLLYYLRFEVIGRS